MEYTQSETLKTPLHGHHLELGGKMTEFSGWEMPVHYGSVVEEHLAVRKKVGVFDVSHMGQIEVSGPEAEACLDYLSTNKIAGKKEGAAIYTVWCNEKGGCVDDVIILRENSTHFWVIANAGNREKDLNHLKSVSSSYQVTIKDHYEQGGIVAIQGPSAKEVVGELFSEAKDLSPMRFVTTTHKSWVLRLAATGYTGEKGFEIFADADAIQDIWIWLMKKNVPPIGLGARDTLRLEMGFALYGHELSDDICPIETVSAWTVKLDKDAFLGKEAIATKAKSDKRRDQVGLVLKGRGIPRQGYPVLHQGEEVGIVTSGTFSPSLKKGIAIAMIPHTLRLGEEVEVQIRGNRVPAEIMAVPFLEKA